MAIPNWLTLSASSGKSGTTVVIVTADTNTTYNQRSYVFTVTTNNTGKQKQVQIIQNASGADDYSMDYLTFEVLSGGTIKVSKQLQYSKNGGNWTNINAGGSLSVSAGDEVEWKGTNSENRKAFSGTTSARFNVYGNVMSLTHNDDFIDKKTLTEDYQFAELFYRNTGVVSVADLILPATTLTESCYYDMFDTCTNLIDSPALPATMLAESCYSDMFQGCKNLKTLPQLPATTLANQCYEMMFAGCSGLTSVPSNYLPATTLAERCYAYMFDACSGLTEVPTLPATTVASGCYMGMYLHCISLSGVPSNYLPATKMESTCYYDMFLGTSLVTAPALPATTLAKECYSFMFESCASLVEPPVLPATIMEEGCYCAMFQNCTSLAYAPALPSISLAKGCYEGMFNSCELITEAPELPATTLAEDCYEMMFVGCSGLISAPALPAPTLVKECYKQMFYGCSHLHYILCLARDISATDCTKEWVQSVAGSGLFAKYDSMNDWVIDSVNGVPIGWTVINSDIVPSLSVSPSSISLGYSSGSTSISITSNYWWYLVKPDWITASADSGESSTTITISATTNYSLSARTGQLIFKYGVSSITCTITQDAFGGNPYELEYFTIEALENDVTIGWNYMSSKTTYARPLEYYSGDTWNTLNTERSITIPLGSKIKFKCWDGSYKYIGNEYRHFFSISGNAKIYGNIHSIFNENYLGDYQCKQMNWLFDGCTGITDASNLILPATNLSGGTYVGLFDGCSSLVNAPALPATGLTEGCYDQMFIGCTSLRTAPELPATTLADSCYEGMFYGCSSLVNAPSILPAISATSNCYHYMFEGCTSLTTAPELPATTLADSCYESMFAGCTSLRRAPDLLATRIVTECYMDMFNGCTVLNYVKCLATEYYPGPYQSNRWLQDVSPTGTFVKAAGATFWESGTSGIPDGWTVQEV